MYPKKIREESITMGPWAIAAIVMVVIVILIMRSRSSEEITNPDAYPHTPAPKPEPEEIDIEQLMEPWYGERNGVPYNVVSYGDGTITIEIDIPKILPKTLEIDARIERPSLEDTEFATEINALLNLGVDYIDLSYNTTRVAAEVPMDKIVVDQKLAERIVDHLIRLRDLASR